MALTKVTASMREDYVAFLRDSAARNGEPFAIYLARIAVAGALREDAERRAGDTSCDYLADAEALLAERQAVEEAIRDRGHAA